MTLDVGIYVLISGVFGPFALTVLSPGCGQSSCSQKHHKHLAARTWR